MDRNDMDLEILKSVKNGLNDLFSSVKAVSVICKIALLGY